MADPTSSSLPLKITVKTLLNIALVWVMATYLNQFFVIGGGWRAIIIVGVILTLLNILVRPVLNVLTLPLKLFATILAVIVVNGAFVYLTHLLILRMDPEIAQLTILGGAWGWIVVAAVLGFGNWLIKEMLR
jgi:putative membrane protein